MTQTSITKETVVDQIASTADWRRRKAEQFPEDARNLRSAEALDTLSAAMKRLPDEHPAFERLGDLWQTLGDQPDDSRLFSRYGFDGPEDADAERFLNLLIEEAVGRAADHAEEEETDEEAKEAAAKEAAKEAAEEAAKEAAEEAAKEAAEEAAAEAGEDDYEEVYKEAYGEAYEEAYDEAYKEAYEEACQDAAR
jgi:hypothetical protein